MTTTGFPMSRPPLTKPVPSWRGSLPEPTLYDPPCTSKYFKFRGKIPWILTITGRFRKSELFWIAAAGKEILRLVHLNSSHVYSRGCIAVLGKVSWIQSSGGVYTWGHRGLTLTWNFERMIDTQRQFHHELLHRVSRKETDFEIYRGQLRTEYPWLPRVRH